MKRFRPILAAVLGLMLWVQGVALAAAPIGPIAPAQADSAMQMPCHDDAATSASDCCDSECPELAGCAMGHLSAATPIAPALLEPAANEFAATGGWPLKTAALSLPDRPPILSHD